MIDLTGAKIGDKLNSSTGFIMKVVLTGDHNLVLEAPSGRLDVFNFSGENSTGVKITSKVDPRPWLKDLPDADLFRGAWLACDNNEEWYTYSQEPLVCDGTEEWYMYGNGVIDELSGEWVPVGIKMPILTGDQWKDSKISIPELKAWQLANQ